jgi:hypothetical protein
MGDCDGVGDAGAADQAEWRVTMGWVVVKHWRERCEDGEKLWARIDEVKEKDPGSLYAAVSAYFNHVLRCFACGAVRIEREKEQA